ncbi:hypothetical protein [Ruegeria arenilitoris]|uniref:hypothetical protein n=1 Tax=Ruegeria arenilitoris TaxID=1173585 RepID=UPI001480DBE3|nr:hypothetical protein [Ruegeria arenilitoris]
MKADSSLKCYSVYLSLALTFISACSTTPKNEEPPLTVMPSTGTVEFRQLASVFSSTCLASFPDTQKTIEQFEKLGFQEVESKRPSEGNYWQLVGNRMQINSTVGQRVIILTGTRRAGNGSTIQNVCNVRAELKNPETHSDTSLVFTMLSGNEVSLNPIDGHEFSKSGELLTQDGIANVSFRQSRWINRTTQGRLPEECNGLSDCITWGEATLEVWVNTDE